MTIRRLTCSCCGGDAGRWQQHWNRDTGFGICADCFDWILSRKPFGQDSETPESMVRLYGVEGVNWGRVGAMYHTDANV